MNVNSSLYLSESHIIFIIAWEKVIWLSFFILLFGFLTLSLIDWFFAFLTNLSSAESGSKWLYSLDHSLILYVCQVFRNFLLIHLYYYYLFFFLRARYTQFWVTVARACSIHTFLSHRSSINLFTILFGQRWDACISSVSAVVGIVQLFVFS